MTGSGDERGATRLVVHADDFGETTEITRGILACIEEGVVTSTSILANMPATTLALREAARRGREASFGVHLNFCEGPPLTRARTLRGPSGSFHGKRALFARALARRLDLDEVEEEATAQVQTVARAGVAISHLDAHKHLHQLPGIAPRVLRVARTQGIERVRCTLEESLWPRGIRAGAGLSRLVRRALAARLLPALAPLGLRTTARVFDVRELIAAGGSEDRAALLRRPGTIAEMFCHPGTELADHEKPGSTARHLESRFLRSREFRELLRAAGVRLATWWDV
jgi:predicted glycoside hydrolase/deacetylase ChbG (UPF0249 family)